MKVILSLFMVCLIAGCATEIHYSESGEMDKGDFYEAIDRLDKERNTDRKSIYNKKNSISFLLDRGLLAHYAGNYSDSSADLLESERLIEEAFTKSISSDFAASLTNDPYKSEYEGEDFENIYVNVFSALNYYHNGDIENALVEIRRMNEKLVYIRDSYEAQQGRFLEKAGNWFFGEINYYTKSALARYLGMLFWRGIGHEDDARIDAQEITAAFEESPAFYSNPLPPELIMDDRVCEELTIPVEMARINMLCFTGLSPYKVQVNGNEWKYRYLLSNPTPWENSDYQPRPFSIAPPFSGLVFRQSPVDRIEAVFDGGQTVELSLLKDIGSVTHQIFEARAARMEMIRVLKGLASLFLPHMGESLYMEFIWPLGAKFNKEKAVKKLIDKENLSVDVRMSRYLPGRAYVGGVNLLPGSHSFSINYYSGKTLLQSKRYDGIMVQKNNLNLIEDSYLKYIEIRPPLVLPADLPDYPERLPAPTDLSNTLQPAAYVENGMENKLVWNPIPGATLYYLYKQSPVDGLFYLYERYWGNSAAVFALPIISKLPGQAAPTVEFYVPSTTPSVRSGRFIVLPVGSNGFGVPSSVF
jgi:hypothetical protein